MARERHDVTGLHRWAAPGRPPLLALHGFTGDAEDFAWLAEQTCHAIDWWAIDLPGHGTQPIDPQHASLDDFVACVERARERIVEVTGHRPDLLGYSMGGRVALHAACRNPFAWRSLITIGATPGITDPGRRLDRLMADEDLAKRMRGQTIEGFLEAWRVLPIIQSQEQIPSAIREPMMARRRQQDPRQLAAALIAVSSGFIPSLWDGLGVLQLPTLLVTGQLDEKFCHIARKMEPLLPAAQLSLIPRVGHCAHLEKPEAFISALLGFLQQRG